MTKVAVFGDAVPGGGTLAEFTAHPLPSLNAARHVAFGSQIAGGRATEGVFVAHAEGLQAIALAGDNAPGVPTGVWLASMRRRSTTTMSWLSSPLCGVGATLWTCCILER